MAMHPHGIIGLSAWANFLNEHEGSFATECPGLDVRFVTLKLNFFVPFMRELCLWVGLLDASAETIKYNLNHKRSVLVMVGGAEESLHARPGVAELVLNKRKGFIKIALQLGTPLVPIFGFGENELFYQVIEPDGSFLKRFQEKFKSLTGVALPFFHGRGIFLYDYGILPLRTPLVTVIGTPIEIPKIENPTTEDLDKYHKLYVESLRKLYYSYKGEDDIIVL